MNLKQNTMNKQNFRKLSKIFISVILLTIFAASISGFSISHSQHIIEDPENGVMSHDVCSDRVLATFNLQENIVLMDLNGNELDSFNLDGEDGRSATFTNNCEEAYVTNDNDGTNVFKLDLSDDTITEIETNDLSTEFDMDSRDGINALEHYESREELYVFTEKDDGDDHVAILEEDLTFDELINIETNIVSDRGYHKDHAEDYLIIGDEDEDIAEDIELIDVETRTTEYISTSLNEVQNQIIADSETNRIYLQSGGAEDYEAALYDFQGNELEFFSSSEILQECDFLNEDQIIDPDGQNALLFCGDTDEFATVNLEDGVVRDYHDPGGGTEMESSRKPSFENDNLYFGSAFELSEYNILADPEAFLLNPEDGFVEKTNTDVDFEYELDSGAGETTFEVVYYDSANNRNVLNSHTLEEGEFETHTTTESFSTADEYQWTVEVDGSSVSETRTFEIIDYQEPTITLDNVEDFKDTDPYETSYTFDIEYNNDAEKLNPEYFLESKLDTETEYEVDATADVSQGDNSYSETITYNFEDSPDTRDWKVAVEDDIERTESATDSYTVEEIIPPTMTNVDTNPLLSEWFGDNIDVSFEGDLGSEDLDFVELRIGGLDGGDFVEDETMVVSAENLDDPNAFSHNEVDAFEYKDFYQDSTIVVQVEAFDVEGTSDMIETSDTVPVRDPIIDSIFYNGLTSFSDGVSIQDDNINVAVEGQIGEAEVEQITYSLDVEDEPNPDDILATEIDFQDGNEYEHEQDTFDILSEYGGNEITLTTTVQDEAGNTDSATGTTTLGQAPSEFILNQPEDNALFIAQEQDVEFEYGLESTVSGEVSLVLEENIIDSFQIGEDETIVTSHTETSLGTGEYEWYVRMDDDNDETWESEPRTFEIREEPLTLDLLEPEQDEIITTLGEETYVEHLFEVDARGLDEEYFYEFNLETEEETVATEISDDLDTGIEQFTENVTELGENNYTWTVEASRSSDGETLDIATADYTIETDPEPTIRFVNPKDGHGFRIDDADAERDISVDYSIETFSDSVDKTLRFDGQVIHTDSQGADSYENYQEVLTNVGAGSYSLTLELENEQEDIFVEETVSFEVSEDLPEITDIRFDPTLEEATVGDELDVIVEGEGAVPDDIDFVEVELEDEFGTTVETVTIPGDELTEGSFNAYVENGIEFTEDLVDRSLRAVGSVTDLAGRTTSYVTGFVTGGSSASISATLDHPYDGFVDWQVEGEEEEIRFEGEVSSVSNEVIWNLQVDSQSLTGDTIDPDSTETIREFFTPSAWSEDQFGEFDARLRVEDSSTGEVKYSDTNTFSIEEDTGDAQLNVLNPENNRVYRIEDSQDSTSVPFGYDINTPEQGELTVRLQESMPSSTIFSEAFGEYFSTRTLYTRSLDEGHTQDNFNRNIEEGHYVVEYKFETDTQTITKERSFEATKREEPDDDPDLDPRVNIIRPDQDGTTIYQDQGYVFTWSAYDATAFEEGSTTTLYVENSEEEIIREEERRYPTQANERTYNYIFEANEPLGDYTVYADFERPDGETFTSDERSFTIVDYQLPETELQQPEDDVTYRVNDVVDFQWETSSYEEPVNTTLYISEKGETEKTAVATRTQGTSETITHEGSHEMQSLGSYEWWVEMNTETDKYRSEEIREFVVEEEEIEESSITLDQPRQGETFEIAEGENSTEIDFRYHVEVYSTQESDVVLELREEDEETWETLQESTQTKEDFNTTYTTTEDLEEAGYFYRVTTEDPLGDENTKTRSFAVGEAEVPQVPDDRNIVRRYLDQLQNLTETTLGATGLLLLSILISVGATGWIKKEFELSTELTIPVVTGFLIGFFLIGWVQEWVAFIMVLATMLLAASKVAENVAGGG